MNKLYNLLIKRIDDIRVLNQICSFFGFINNYKIKKLIYKLECIDTILNFEYFVKQIESIINNKTMIKLLYPNCENEIYGHLKVLYEYAGLPYEKNVTINIEHGVDFSENPIPYYKLAFSTLMIFQSDYKRDRIFQNDSSMLTFSIGPYIHYATDYYDENTIKKLKIQWGKTLLVVLNHTIEGKDIDRNYEKYYKKLIEPFEDKYDTILICLYWIDCKENLINYFQSFKKVKCVTAGFRYDSKFLCKIKSLLKLSDFVITNGIGTFLGYALYMKKPIKYIDCEDSIDEKNYKPINMHYYKTEIIEAINNANIENIYNYYWSESSIKNPTEIKKIFELNKLILNCSNFKMSRFRKVRTILKF